jgi:sn-1 stearoyl-lipid 9-desaturase
MANAFLLRVLGTPTYGWTRGGKFYRPTTREIFSHWGSRMNLAASRKNWLSVTGVLWSFALVPFLVVFLTQYFSWLKLGMGLLYALVWLGTANTVWLHRYCTHQAFTFSHPIYRFIARNLTVRIIAEELYVVSHHVHHGYTEEAGDPYNAHGGRLYCFLAAELHQTIARDLSPKEYQRVVDMVKHTGVVPNTYAQYRSWGSVCHPARLFASFTLNWIFWYGAFFLMGGHGLACAIFGLSAIWAIGIRDFNYDAHGCGKDKRDKTDFHRKDLSINQLFSGTVAGEWHNNHHAFPGGVRSGFLWWQLDTAYLVIRVFKMFGGIASMRDYKARFLEKYIMQQTSVSAETETETGSELPGIPDLPVSPVLP